MLKENISLTQLLALVFNFLLGGSTIIIGIGIEARQDAWLAIIIGTLIGIGLMYFYYSLIRLLPNKNLFEIMEYCLTRPVAIFFSLGYITYFLYITSRMIRTFAELITTAILPVTPIGVITLTMMLLIAYIIYLGLEVLCRVSEIFTPYILGFIILIMIFLIVSGEVEWHYIQPVLGEGMKQIIKTMPSLITFPFGELLTFTVILSSVTQFKKSKKILLIAVLLAGLLLMMGTLLILVTLGVDEMQYATFPLLNAVRRVSIGHFIERIDAFVVFVLMLGVLVKSSVYLYGGVKGLEYVFRVPYRYFAVPVSMIVSILSILTASNYAEHSEEVKFTLYYLHLPMQFAVPTVILIMLIWKTKKHNSDKNGVEF